MSIIALKLARKLRLRLFAIYFVAIIIVLLFETGALPIGMVKSDTTNYILQVIGVLLSLALIPISLKGFNIFSRRALNKNYEQRIGVYKLLANLRLLAFFIVIEYSILLYYLIDDTVGLYCALIGVVCSLFCFPTNGQISADLDEEHK